MDLLGLLPKQYGHHRQTNLIAKAKQNLANLDLEGHVTSKHDVAARILNSLGSLPAKGTQTLGKKQNSVPGREAKRHKYKACFTLHAYYKYLFVSADPATSIVTV